MKEPILGYESYDIMLEISKMGKLFFKKTNFKEIDKVDSKKVIWILEQIVSKLSPPYRDILNVLLYVLHECDCLNKEMKVNHFQVNSKSENLAKVMTLNFTKKITMTQDSLTDFHLVIHTTQLLIQNYKSILNVCDHFCF
jgi:hypothetical protein